MVAFNLDSWSNFLDAQVRAEPLAFVLGMRHRAPNKCAMHSHPSIEIVYHEMRTGVTRLAPAKELPFTEGSVDVWSLRISPSQNFQNPSEGYVRLAERYVRENFKSIQSIEEIARSVGISHGHLRHCFKSLRGKV